MERDIKLIQFDWSGTISDDRAPVFSANMRMCDAYGIQKYEDMPTWLKTTTKSVQDWFLMRGAKASRDEIWDLYNRQFRTVLSEGIKPAMYEDVPEVLRALADQGRKMIVVSSHPAENVKREAQEYGIESFFTTIIGSVAEKSVSIKEICKEYGFETSGTAYVGDMVGDVLAAQKAEVLPVAVSRGYHSEEVLLESNPFAVWQDLRPLTVSL